MFRLYKISSIAFLSIVLSALGARAQSLDQWVGHSPMATFSGSTMFEAAGYPNWGASASDPTRKFYKVQKGSLDEPYGDVFIILRCSDACTPRDFRTFVIYRSDIDYIMLEMSANEAGSVTFCRVRHDSTNDSEDECYQDNSERVRDATRMTANDIAILVIDKINNFKQEEQQRFDRNYDPCPHYDRLTGCSPF